MITFTVPDLPTPGQAYDIQRPYMQRPYGMPTEQHEQAIQTYANTVIAIDTYLSLEAEQYRYWYELGDTLEMDACVRAMETAAWSRSYLTLNDVYLAWKIERGVITTDRNMLLMLQKPPKPLVIKPVVPKVDHIAMLTGTVARREAARQQADKLEVEGIS